MEPDDRRTRAWTRAFVGIGLALRVWHYAVNHSIWYDEAVLLVNVLKKGYGGLVGPLDYAVAAPPVFVWFLKAVSDVCGDVSYCWRALPFLCSVATLLLTVPLVRRTLTPFVGLVAVGMVALSDNHVWLGLCIKPYASDALFTTALLLAYAGTRHWSAARRLAWLVPLVPLVLCASYPAAFVFGGLLLALLPQARREGKAALAVWLAACAAAAGTFAALYFGPIRDQRVPSLVEEWERMFPPFREPARLPWWVIDHTAVIFHFCYNPAGFYYAAVAPFGFAALWRTGRRDWAVILAAPFALSLVAAAFKAYPYGYNRLMFFIAPCALLLGAHGMEAAFRHVTSRRLHVLTAVLLLLVEAGIPASHLFVMWDVPDSSGAAEYVREQRQPGDLVASDEKTYDYFFLNELLPLEVAREAVPPGGRVWVPMDHYNLESRIGYIEEHRLPPTKFERLRMTQFRNSTVFLYVRKPEPR